MVINTSPTDCEIEQADDLADGGYMPTTPDRTSKAATGGTGEPQWVMGQLPEGLPCLPVELEDGSRYIVVREGADTSDLIDALNRVTPFLILHGWGRPEEGH